MDYPVTLSQQLRPHLKSLRRFAGLSQAQLADLMGVSRARVSAIEGDPAKVSFEQMLELLHFLGAQVVLRPVSPEQSWPVVLPEGWMAERSFGQW